jgi:hypothetical protein
MLTQVAMALAMITLPFAMLSTWVAAFISDTDRYVETVTPLASDPVVKKAAVKYIERETLNVLGSSDKFPDVLRSMDLSCLGVDSQLLGGFADLISGFLGDQFISQIQPLIEPGIHAAIVQAVDSPAFESIWVGANRTAHEQVLAALEDRPSSAQAKSDAILLPLNQVVNLFTGNLKCQTLIPQDAVKQIAPSFTLVDADDLKGARTGYEVLDTPGYWLIVAFVVFLAVAIATGRPRRRVIMQLGIGFVLAMALLDVVMAFTKSKITSSGADKDVFDAIWNAITKDLSNASAGVLIASAVAALWAWERKPLPAGQPVPSNQPELYIKGGLTAVLVVVFLVLVSR